MWYWTGNRLWMTSMVVACFKVKFVWKNWGKSRKTSGPEDEESFVYFVAQGTNCKVSCRPCCSVCFMFSILTLSFDNVCRCLITDWTGTHLPLSVPDVRVQHFRIYHLKFPACLWFPLNGLNGRFIVQNVHKRVTHVVVVKRVVCPGCDTAPRSS